jgi:hypothetical protein
MSFFIDRPRYKVRWQNILQQFKNEKRFLDGMSKIGLFHRIPLSDISAMTRKRMFAPKFFGHDWPPVWRRLEPGTRSD